MSNTSSALVWTIGHSNRPLEVFLDLLNSEEIKMVCDVRRFPVSRRFPHFSGPQFGAALGAQNISYLHLPELGGRRSPRADSHNTAWRNQAFRGYADYMETAAFRAGMEALTKEARARPTAILCAEALWWQCHRGLVADHLKSQGWDVRHIVGKGKTELHPYTSAARVRNGQLSYTGEQTALRFP